MPLVLAPLEKATASLARSIAQPLDEFTRDSTIQRFEYTSELAWKSVRRVLLNEMGMDEIEGTSRREVFRIAAQKGFFPDPIPWFEFHEARNRTSHTYNEATAEEVYEVAVRFLTAVEALMVQLRRYV